MRVRASAVYENDGKILCMKYMYGGKEVFGIPGGGVDKDISIANSLNDEWKEELGVKVDIGDIIFVGEAPSAKRHPQTIHLVFLAKEIHGNPKVRPEHTSSIEAVWLDIGDIPKRHLYPDIGSYLYHYFQSAERNSIPFIQNCMERGFF